MRTIKEKEEMRKFLHEEILGNPPLFGERMKDLERILTEILRESNQLTRDELRAFLERWEIRTLFVDALQEQLDEEKAEKMNDSRTTLSF